MYHSHQLTESILHARLSPDTRTPAEPCTHRTTRAYLPGLSARPCWPRCFPAPLTVGSQRGSRPAMLSASGVMPVPARAAAARAAAAAAKPQSKQPACYRIILSTSPRSFPLCTEETPSPLLPPSVSPLPPPSTLSPPTPHPPRVSVTPFSSPPAPSDALMLRMFQPPLVPLPGVWYSRLEPPQRASVGPEATPTTRSERGECWEL